MRFKLSIQPTDLPWQIRLSAWVSLAQSMVLIGIGLVIWFHSFFVIVDSAKQLYSTVIFLELIGLVMLWAAFYLVKIKLWARSIIITFQIIFIPISYSLFFGSEKFFFGVVLFFSALTILIALLIPSSYILFYQVKK